MTPAKTDRSEASQDSMSPIAVTYIRLVAAHWWPLAGWVLLVMAAALGHLLWDGLGRQWEARARIAVEGPAEIMPILKARIASQDLARHLGVSAASVSADGLAVLDIIATASAGPDAVLAANAVLDAIVSGNEQARRASAEDYRALIERREQWVVRESAAISAQAQDLQASLRKLEERMLPAIRDADQASVRLSTDSRWWIPSIEQRRLERLERERETHRAALERLELRRVQIVTPPLVPAEPRAIKYVLHRIDRAVSATRLPIRVWHTLGAAGLSAVLLGLVALGVTHWWQEATTAP